MRMWSLNPVYLDAAGLVALWRETLLAQKVLQGLTKGYRNHPQLDRFKSQPSPVASIGFYLSGVLEEARARGYNFDGSKICYPGGHDAVDRLSFDSHVPAVPLIEVGDGQLAYELAWLRSKLERRSPEVLTTDAWAQVGASGVVTHPLFVEAPGPIAEWEKIS
ncbi:DNA lyase [Trueperella pecoris]|uniref:DNA lyase n=1 Tax=Trueperella pecoris TaxID=2733571 RepID=A0A7M1R4D0_9ACTO|nr:pyrimidine dimer DNA glycosylase/endonuclease V [Trueperella pecoris]QOR48325.1 DNA lyase [Trueperella pecoris]